MAVLSPLVKGKSEFHTFATRFNHRKFFLFGCNFKMIVER